MCIRQKRKLLPFVVYDSFGFIVIFMNQYSCNIILECKIKKSNQNDLHKKNIDN